MNRFQNPWRFTNHFPAVKSLFLAFLLLSLFFGILPVYAEEAPVSLQILSINDFHGSLVQTAKVSSKPAGGVACLAAYLKERQLANANTLLVHSGDAIGASQPVSSLFADEPTLELLNFMGFDVGTVGNHEFDNGYQELRRLQYSGTGKITGYFPGSAFPLIVSNVVDSKTKDPIFPPYIIKVVAGIPIGFIGAITSETPTIVLTSGIQGLEFLNPVSSINKYAEVLKGKGVQAIMVLIHEGGFQDSKTGEISGPIKEIVEGLDPAVDVVFSGHTHSMLNGVIKGKLVVQAFSGGTAFADVDLTLDPTTGDVTASKAEIVTVWTEEKKPEPRIANLVANYQKNAGPRLEQKVAQFATELTRTQTEAGESALGNLIADSQRAAAKTQIAFMNPGGIRRDLPAGSITWGMLFETQPFGNFLMRFQMTGDQIYRVLDQQWQPNGTEIRIRFLQTSGLKITWDDSQPLGSKVVKVTLENGTALDKKASYSVVANNYISSGGDNFSVFKEITNQDFVSNDLDALVDYLKTFTGPVSVKIGRVSKVK